MKKMLVRIIGCLVALIAASWCGAAELIMNEADWIRVARSENGSSATYSLGADVTLSSWESKVFDFSGTLEGNGHSIKLTGDLADVYVSNDGTISKYEGRLYDTLGSHPNGATFRNVFFDNQLLAEEYINCTFINCRASYSGSGCGAIAFRTYGCNFTNCSAVVNIATTTNTFGKGVGGLVGGADGGSFVNCSTEGTIIGDGHVGGLIGRASEGAIIKNCWSSCKVSGNELVGGMFGSLDDGTEYKQCVVSNCCAKGDVRGGGWVGGFAGHIDNCQIHGCSAKGRVSEDSAYVVGASEYDRFGGFAGSITEGGSGDGVFSRCLASGDVSAVHSENVGGFAGLIGGNSMARTSLHQVAARGSVEGAHLVGGFTGNTYDSDFADCAAYGSATGFGNANGQCDVGAFTGSYGSKSTWARCYASGKVVAKIDGPYVHKGGIMPYGMSESFVPMIESTMKIASESCYWNVDSTGQRYSAVGSGLKSSQAAKSSSYPGWNFNQIWKISDGHPELRLDDACDCPECGTDPEGPDNPDDPDNPDNPDDPDDPDDPEDPCKNAFLNIGRTFLEFNCEGGSVTYKVESSTNWTSTITSPDGAVASTLTATADEDAHTISVGKNDTGKERSWIIHYDNGCMTAEVKIMQKACKPDPDCPCTIDVGSSSIVFDDCKADSKRVSVTSSGSWSSSVNGGPGLTVTSIGSKGSSEAVFMVTENTTGKLREWDVVFTGRSECGDECSTTVHVAQGACKEDPTEDKCFIFADTAQIAVDGCSSAARKVEINASSNWTSRVEGGPGLNVTPSGKGGTTTVVFNIDESPLCSTREWTVIFSLVGSKCGEVSTSVVVKQICGCGCRIFVTPSRRTVGPGLSLGLVSVDSSHFWTIDWHSVPSWVVPLVGAGDSGTTIVPYLVREQPSCDDAASSVAREAKVRFVSSEGCSDVFDLVQAGRECCTYLDISHDGEEIRTFVTNNAAFSLPLAIRSSSAWKVASLPPWITVGVEDHKANVLTLNASDNPEAERSGEVRLTNGSGNVRDLTVVQTKETFAVEPSRVFLAGTAGVTSLSVSGTSGWTLTVPDGAKSWLSVLRESPDDSTVTLALQENATGEIRETELVFSCGLITKEVTVAQDSLGVRLAIVGEAALQGDESAALKCYLVQPGGRAKAILPDWSVEGSDEVRIDDSGTLRVEGTLLVETVVTVTARYEQDERMFTARHEVTITPKIGPGVWTHDVAAALAAAQADGKLIVVLDSKPDSCPHCREFEPIAFNPEFLKWAHDNKVYLIQAVRSGPCDESVTDAYFWTLAESFGRSGSVSLPALAFAYPEPQDIGVGLDCARVGKKIGTVDYDGSLQTLIEGVASYLKPDKPATTFAEALGVPELECAPWGSTKNWQLRIDPDWTCDGNGSATAGNNLREWTATPGFSFNVTGPTQMKFSYSKSFSSATFSVDCTAGELYRDDTPGEKTDWKQVVLDIPAGEQTVYFKVRLGDAALHLNEEYDYNGFWIDDLQFGEFEHDEPDPTEYHTVTFDLGWYGVRTGGGELSQTVMDGDAAIAPEFVVVDGWTFAGWNTSFDSVTSDLMVTALWKRKLTDGFAEFAEPYTLVEEGGTLRLEVLGGSSHGSSSVKLYLAPESATAKDLDLTKLTVDGVAVKNAKFPLTLSWAAGDVSEKVIEIPIKTDTAVEGYEQLDLQLADANGIGLGDACLCSVSVKDETVGATLAQAVNNPLIKVATTGDGKWIAANGNEGYIAGDRGMYHLQSPALASGKSSTLNLSGVSGSGQIVVAYRFVGDYTGGKSASLRLLADKKPLKTDTVLYHSSVGSTWNTFTITDDNKGSHTYSYVFTQGDDPDVHVEVAMAKWVPAGGSEPVMVYVTSNGSGYGTVSGMGFYAIGATAKITAKPAPGRQFAGWYKYSNASQQYELYDQNHMTLSIKVTESFDLLAMFFDDPYVRAVAVPADGGKVSGSGYVAVGKRVTLKATANKNFTFEGWYAAKMDDRNAIDESQLVATTASLVIDRGTKPTANSKTSTTVTDISGDVTYFAKFKSYPEAFVSIEATDGNVNAGKITGTGKYAPGKKVTLKAMANKGYVFNGWYEGEGLGGLVTQATSYVFEMPTNDVAYEARFVTAEEDKASIGATVAGFAFGAAAEGDGSTGLATNVMCGVYLEWPVAASALSQPTVAVAGLPAGLKFTAKPVTSKVGTGKTAVTVTNVPPNTIYGAPTAASKVDKYGVVTPSKVKVTVTTAGKSKSEYVIDLAVDPLPAWAQGEFSGLASMPDGRLGSASMSVTAAGKVTGKVIVNGTNVSFTAASYDASSKTVGETNLVALVTGKLGKEAVTGGITVVASGATGTFAGAEMSLCRNVWKDKGAEPVPAEAQGLYTVKLGAGEHGTGYLSLTVDKKGAVKVAGKAPDGTALSATATLVPSGEGYFADLFCAPSGYKGGYVGGRLGWGTDGRVSSDGLDWTSFNPESTTDYYAGGFDRDLSASGAWYSKTAKLLDYYATLDFEAENRGVGQSCWANLTVSVDQAGKKFVVDQKKTTPVQDKATKTWSYDGANDAALEFSFTQATGIWKGSFLWWLDEPKHASQKIPFEGIMVQGEDLEGFGTYDVQSSYIPYDKKGNPQREKTYKVKESLPVKFIDSNKDM